MLMGLGGDRLIDVVPLVLGLQLGLWFRDVEDVMAVPIPGSSQGGVGGEGLEEDFGLYRRAAKLMDMGNAFLKWVLFAVERRYEG
jgi:hypothetical protein